MDSTAQVAKIAAIKHLALDMDGTIYQGAALFDFTLPFLAQMRTLGIGVTFLTNNSSRSAADYIHHLAAMDLQVGSDQIFTSGMGTIEYLQSHHPEYKRLFILGTKSLRGEFSRAGFEEISRSHPEERNPEESNPKEAGTAEPNTAEPDAVIVGFDSELVYDRLCVAGYWIAQGKPFIATHPDLVCPTDQKRLLVDCGAICASLTKATGRLPDVVLGKPHPVMLEGLLRRHDLRPGQLAMIGDRLSTDIAMARTAGTVGILVLTGEATALDAENCSAPPDFVVADLAAVGQLLQDRGAIDNEGRP